MGDGTSKQAVWQESHLWLRSSGVDQPGDVLQGTALQHLAELSVEVEALSRGGGSRWHAVATRRTTRGLCKPVAVEALPCCYSCSWGGAPLIGVVTPATRIILLIALSNTPFIIHMLACMMLDEVL